MESLSLNKNTLLKLSLILLFVIYSYFFWLMIKITLQYLPVDTDVAFLSIKQDYIHLPHYRVAFFIHVFSALLVLPAGYTQFSGSIRRKYPKVHRQLGWLYAVVTVFLAGPSGFIIGLYANGGLSSRIAFCLLALLWILFTVLAIMRIIKKQVASHRAWMIRSFALALSAITLRAWKYSLVALFHPRPMDVYQVVAWLGWTLNLLIAEIIIFNKRIHGIKNTH
jgi:uncharacterized membrane protein